ncbi:MAG TPA: hypothetical protein VGJ79_01790 [Candidatus Dormibacteraeota bacterium]|jgi:uncharacterized integral membrane protein
MLLLIGPAVAVIGIVAVVFVMRHKSVEKRSMYSARRSQIEHKVRAARQRTLAPGKRADKGEAIDQTASAAPAMTYETSAYASPPVAPPPQKAQSWDAGPVTTPVDTPAFTPPAPAYEPPPAAPAYEPPPAQPAYRPPPAQPAYQPPPFEAPETKPEWTPAPAAPLEPERAAAAEPPASSAGGGASWSVVGESKASSEPEPAPRKKSSKDAQAGAWQLASGEVAGDEPDDAPRRPSAAIAIAQYAVLVVGLVMVLIGVVVMVANSHGS